jgi:hypothetical protein
MTGFPATAERTADSFESSVTAHSQTEFSWLRSIYLYLTRPIESPLYTMNNFNNFTAHYGAGAAGAGFFPIQGGGAVPAGTLGAAAPGAGFMLAELPPPAADAMPSLARVRQWTPAQLFAFMNSLEPASAGQQLAVCFKKYSGLQFLQADLTRLNLGSFLDVARRTQRRLAAHPHVVYDGIEAANAANQMLINTAKATLNAAQARVAPPVSETKDWNIHNRRLALLQKLVDGLRTTPAIINTPEEAKASGIVAQGKISATIKHRASRCPTSCNLCLCPALERVLVPALLLLLLLQGALLVEAPLQWSWMR